MRKSDLARRLARMGRISPAEAADRLDSVIHSIVRSLRQGQPARLPGLGTLQPGHAPAFEPEAASARPETSRNQPRRKR